MPHDHFWQEMQRYVASHYSAALDAGITPSEFRRGLLELVGAELLRRTQFSQIKFESDSRRRIAQ